MKKALGSLAAGLCLGSVCLASFAQPHLLTESQMDAVSANAQSSFALGNVLAALNARGASARERAPVLAQLRATAPRHAQGGAIGISNVNSAVSGDSANVAGLAPAVAGDSARVLGAAATPAAGGNTLRSAGAPINSPISMSSASSSL